MKEHISASLWAMEVMIEAISYGIRFQKKTIRSRDVTFNENVMYSATKQQEKVRFAEVTGLSTERLPFQEIDQNQPDDGHREEVAENNQQIEKQEEEHDEDEEVVEPQLYEFLQGQTPAHWVQKSVRVRKEPDRYSPLYYILCHGYNYMHTSNLYIRLELGFSKPRDLITVGSSTASTMEIKT